MAWWTSLLPHGFLLALLLLSAYLPGPADQSASMARSGADEPASILQEVAAAFVPQAEGAPAGAGQADGPPGAASGVAPSSASVRRAAASAEEAQQALARAEALRRVGDHQAAVAALEPLRDHPDDAIAAEASYRTALLRLELGYATEAAGMLENLLEGFPRAAMADRATFLLAVARRQAGDCGRAVDALFHYQARGGLLEPYVSLQLAMCYQRLGDTGAALERTDEALLQGGPRLLQVEALERQAEILERAGDRAGALARYERIAPLARARNYRADVHLAAARLNAELGREAEAAAHLATVVNEVPNARNAPAALDRLAVLQAQDRVSYFQAGLVRYFGSNYGAAERNFQGALATPGEAPNHPAAAYYRAVSRVRQGAEMEGARDLLALPGAYPGSRYAPDALLRGGKVLESNGAFADAALAYRRVAYDYQLSVEAKEGLFRLGFVNFLRGFPGEAAAAWAQLGSSGARTDLRTLGLLWHGKMESMAGDHALARARWEQAVEIGPTWYGGVRAGSLLQGSPYVAGNPLALDEARVELSAEEWAELDAWTGARGLGVESLAAEQAAEPAFARADELLALGLTTEAGWEFDHLGGRYAEDPARLAGLALALRQRGLEGEALKYAQASIDAARVVSREAPTAIQKLLYPLPYLEVFAVQGEKHGVDPLLFAALVRQESLFDPRARSVANAIGLTQVIPSTAHEIAGALGRRDFQLEDLYKPAVSLEFGTFYFGQRLKRFGGALFPALAAYNAGDGAVDRWIGNYGLEDADSFAERIPYTETNHYVKIVYENYGLYRALYGAR